MKKPTKAEQAQMRKTWEDNIIRPLVKKIINGEPTKSEKLISWQTISQMKDRMKQHYEMFDLSILQVIGIRFDTLLGNVIENELSSIEKYLQKKINAKYVFLNKENTKDNYIAWLKEGVRRPLQFFVSVDYDILSRVNSPYLVFTFWHQEVVRLDEGLLSISKTIPKTKFNALPKFRKKKFNDWNQTSKQINDYLRRVKKIIGNRK